MATYTIGSTNPSGASNGTGAGISANSLWLTKRTLSGAAAGATWTALRAWITGNTGGADVCKLAIYSDSSGSPTTLLGGGEVSVAQSAAAAEYTIALPGTAPATNGDYWVGFHLKNTSGLAPWYASSGGTMAYGTPAYASGLPSPFNETATNGVNNIRVAADAEPSFSTWNGTSTVSLTATVTTAGTSHGPAVLGVSAVAEAVTVTTRGTVPLILVARSTSPLTLVPVSTPLAVLTLAPR